MRKFLKNIILYLIELIERYEYRNMSLDEDDISKKIIDTVDISNEGISVLSHDGYHPITQVHKTQPYHIYELLLESGDKLTCADNHIVFCEGFVQKFVKDLTTEDYVMTTTGPSRVVSIEKSKHKISMYDVTVDSEDHSYYGNNILNHNTVTAGIFLLWYAIFNTDRTCGLLSNKFQSAKEIADKIKEMMDYLPFFMKPGILRFNATDIKFDNGCRFVAQATTPRSFIGFTVHCMYMDEFAHVEPNILDEFYENAMPTISSMEDSKIIITSTPNGYNKFYELYQGAIDGKNSYHPLRVDWWQVPGRDEEWKNKMIQDCGGEDEFMRQYGNSFLTTGNTLLSPESLERLQKGRILYVPRELAAISRKWEDEYSNLLWHPEFDIESLHDPSRRWVLAVDISEGGGGDYSIVNIFEVLPKGLNDLKNIDKERKASYFKLVQRGRFRCNTIDVAKLAKLVYILGTDVIDSDNVRMVIEYNTFGAEFLYQIQNVFGDKNEFDMSTILKFKHTAEAPVAKYGLKVRSDNKPTMCIALKGYISDGTIEVSDTDTIDEFENFSKVGNTWKASRGHDDLAMTTVDVTAIFDHPYFDVIIEELLDNESNKEIAKLYEDAIDAKFGNLYDNYENINRLGDSDIHYPNYGSYGTLNNNSIYR